MRMFNIDLETTLLTYVDVNIYHYDESLNLVKLLFRSQTVQVHSNWFMNDSICAEMAEYSKIWQGVEKYGKLR